MAHTLFYKSNKDLPHPYTFNHAPPSWANSPSLQVPDVFLIAPEEENVPPWLLFDAAKDSIRDLSRTPDLEFLDITLDALRRADRASATNCRRGSGGETGEGLVLPRGGDSHLRQMRWVDEEIPWPGIQGMESEEDSVVVEVVKVRKADGMQESGENGRTMKKSKTFKAAASKAFRSIKNVAKGSNWKPHAQDIWSSNGSARTLYTARLSNEGELPHDPPRPDTPTMSRRNSLTLSQLFHTPKQKNRLSAEVPEPVLPAFTLLTDPASSSTRSPCNQPHLLRNESLDAPDDQLGVRPLSPSPSTKSSFRRRLSMLELRRVFTSSKSSGSQETLSIPAMSRDGSTNSSAPSTSTGASFEIPGTPDEACASTPLPSPHAEKDKRARRGDVEIAEAELGGDISFEMKLESLHFDSLSFDPDMFS